ncbi:MAG: arginyltransferase [Gammaproteobacteria bacterium]|nr:arginyltransferase [Gammaproteobacteria bacterium]
MKNESDSLNSLLSMRFFVTPLHDCNYFPERQAITLVVDPETKLNKVQYSELSRLGFRRSGGHVYRPHCPNCRDCIPIRIEAAKFKPNRSQRRVLKKNQQIKWKPNPVEFSEEHFQLYRYYIQGRHPAGGMDNDDPNQYRQFIRASWCETRLFELRENDQLLGVAVTDQLENGLSAVYTFFDPSLSDRSLGTYAILRQIEECRDQELKWLYLGYWIPDSPKMQYKSRFRPFEYFDGQAWHLKE